MKKANTPSFLEGQFIPAHIPDSCTHRLKVMKSFYRASKDRVIYVGAQADSGKTLSTLLWLRDSQRKSVWIGLDEEDNSPDVFYKRLAYGIFSLYPDNPAMRAVVESPAFSATPVEHVIQLICELPPDVGAYALIFDNMHLITNSEVRKTLPAVLKYLPSSFVTIILSRHQIPEVLLGLIKNREVDIVGTCDLQFSPKEIKSHFKSMGHSLSDRDAAAVYELTEGWPMGVDTLAKRGMTFLDKGDGFDEYFEMLLWDRWDTSVQDFCLRTSIVDEFTPQLASSLTGRDEAYEIIEFLSCTNSFLNCTSGEIYRYHRLFQDFLQRRLACTPLHTAPLYRIAADYYKEQKNHWNALRFRLRCGDYEGMDEDLLLSLWENRWKTADDWTDFLHPLFLIPFPERAYEELPPLHILSAWYYYLKGQYREYFFHMDAVISNLHRISQIDSRFIEYAILVFSADHRLTMKEKMQRYDMLGRFVNEYTSERLASSMISCSHNMPYIHRSNLDCSDLAMDETLFDKLGKTFGLLLGNEWTYIRPAITACLMYERNQLESALNQNTLASDLIGENAMIDGRICVEVLHHSILWHLGYSIQADTILTNLSKLAADEVPFFLPNLNAYKTKLLLFDGNRAAAKEWLNTYLAGDTEHTGIFYSFRNFTTARAYVVLGQTKDALRCLLMLENYGKTLNRPLDEAESLVLQSAILWSAGQRQDAVDKLSQALALMQPFGFIRVIADEGMAVLPILKRIKADLDRTSCCTTDMRTYLNEVTLAAYSMSKHCRGSLPQKEKVKPLKLSKQQKNMLIYYSQGYKNADIARITGLSIPTIKAHASLAYKKLGVNNALDAVLKARDLKVI